MRQLQLLQTEEFGGGARPAETNSLPRAFARVLPHFVREREFPPHAVRRWMRQRQLLQTEAFGGGARPAETNSLPRAYRAGTPSLREGESFLLTQ